MGFLKKNNLFFKSKKAFTLTETVIVVTIIAALMSVTIGMGYNYIKSLKVKSDKEKVVSTIDYALSYTRATNYYQNQRYTALYVILQATGISSVLSNGTTLDNARLGSTTLSWTGNYNTIILTPYARDCALSGNSLATGFSFTMQGTINSERFCFTWDLTVCKFYLTSC